MRKLLDLSDKDERNIMKDKLFVYLLVLEMQLEEVQLEEILVELLDIRET